MMKENVASSSSLKQLVKTNSIPVFQNGRKKEMRECGESAAVGGEKKIKNCRKPTSRQYVLTSPVGYCFCLLPVGRVALHV